MSESSRTWISKEKLWAVALIAILGFAAGGMARAQRITATLGGTVSDSSGAVITNADIKVINDDTQTITKLNTDREGRFSAPALPPGHYSVHIEANGFKQLDRHGIILLVDQTIELNLTLDAGSTTESVVVTEQPPLLNTETSDSGAVIGTKEILDLPLNQRNPFALILLAPGVTGTSSASFLGMQFSVNGGRRGTTDVLINGVSSTPSSDAINALTVFPSVDAVEEFKVQTSNYSSEFGLSGGGIVNVIFKSGTNQIHGSAYDFLRNSYMDANNFFANRANLPLAAFKRNQFGGTVGGPIVLPKIYNGRDKTFFFVGYEGLRQRQQSVATTTVPTLAMRQGDFTDLTTSAGKPITLYDPDTTVVVGGTYMRSEFAQHNIIPVNRFDPVSAQVLNYYPQPNQVGTNGTNINNYIETGASPTNIDQVDGKVDEYFTQRHHVSFSFSLRDPFTGVPAYFPAAIRIAQDGSENRVNALGGVLDYTFTVSPTDLFEVRYGQFSLNYKTTALGDGFDPTQLGMPGYIASHAQILQFPGFEAAGYVSLGSGSQTAEGAAKFSTNSWIVSNTKVIAAHTLKMGFETRFLRNKSNQIGRSTGDYSFSQSLTQGPIATIGSATAGDGFASLLLGVGTGTLTQNFKIVDTSSRYLAGYFQDDWKATPRLTLNLGLRYELFQPRTEKYNRASWFDPNIASPLAATTTLTNLKGGLVFPGVDGEPLTQTDTQYTNLSPRIGLAFQALQHLSIRAAWGIFYANAPNEAASTVAQFGYRTDTSYTGTTDNGITQVPISNPFPDGLIPVTGNSAGALTSVGATVTSVIRRSPTPYSEQTLFDLQYELPKKWMLEAAYVGTNGLQLTRQPSLNQLPNKYLALKDQLVQQVPNPFYGKGLASGSLSKPTVQQNFLLTPFPQFTGVNLLYAPGAFSSYNSIQLQLQKQFDRNLTVRLSFTGSKFMDNYSSSNTSNFNGDATSQDSTNLASDWSLSTVDIPKNFVGAVVYQLPFGRGQMIGSSWNRAMDAAFGGWVLNTIVTAQSGTPLGLSAANNNNNFSPGERPNWNGQRPRLSGRVENRLNTYFNTSVYSQPDPYTYGNTSRTVPNLRAPSTRNVDLSLFKEFSLVETLKAQFRLEAFNAFNTPIFSAPNTAYNSSSFGAVTSQANNPRQLQVALKLIF